MARACLRGRLHSGRPVKSKIIHICSQPWPKSAVELEPEVTFKVTSGSSGNTFKIIFCFLKTQAACTRAPAAEPPAAAGWDPALGLAFEQRRAHVWLLDGSKQTVHARPSDRRTPHVPQPEDLVPAHRQSV